MQDGHQSESDIHVLGWPSAWVIASTGLIIAMVGGESPSTLDDSGHALLGAASGCLVSAWTLVGTWNGLAVRPWILANGSSRFAAQLATTAPCFISVFALILVVWLHHNTSILLLITQLILTTIMAFTGPMIAWQWTRRRIHRGETQPRRSQSIRQILEIVLTIALAIGATRMSQRWLGINSSTTTVIVSISINWVLMLCVLLGKRPWFTFPLIGLLIAEWVTVSTMFDLQSKKNSQELAFLGAMLHCSFGFSLLFLLQMRASGYRWLHDKMRAEHETNN